jgi:hypothetical protein
MNKVSVIVSSLALGAVLLPAAAFAQTTNVTAGVSTSVVTASTSAHVRTGTTGTTAIARADAEITRRITNLTSASVRIGQLKNISSTDKTSLQTSITTQISEMTALKAKIDSDTDAATLKADITSITSDYRIYMLVIPQARIAAATDRAQTIVADMQAMAPQLQARITADQTAGGNVAAAQAAYSDMQTKVSDANIQAAAALNETVSLTPDQGNASIEASNTAAIKDAASKIKTVVADLKAASTDISTIMNAVKGTGSGHTTASTSATVQ